MEDEEYWEGFRLATQKITFETPNNLPNFNAIFIWACFRAERIGPVQMKRLMRLSGYAQQSSFTSIKQAPTWQRVPISRKLALIDFPQICFVLDLEMKQNDFDRLSTCRTGDDLVRFVGDLTSPPTDFELQDDEVVCLVPMETASSSHRSQDAALPIPERWIHEEIKPLLEDRSVLILTADCHSGLGHALFNLDETIALGYDKIIHVRPRHNRDNANDLMIRVLDELGVRCVQGQGPTTIATMLAQALVSKNVLLVLHNCHVVFHSKGWSNTDLPKDLDRGLRDLKATLGKEKNCRIIATFVTGLTPVGGLMQDLRLKDEALHEPALQKEDISAAKDEILKLVRHYQDRAGMPPQAPNLIGSTGKRLHGYLSRLVSIKCSVGAGTTRLRAAAMANPDILAEHDPTYGFREILGDTLAKRAPEFARLHNDIVGAISCTKLSAGRPLEALRLVSSAVFWFSKEMNARLCKVASSNDPLNWKDFEEIQRNPRRISYDFQISEKKGDSSRVTAPFAVRCIVQDLWRNDDPKTYIVSHKRFASIMLEVARSSDCEELLSSEYPYEVPREGAALVWYASAIKYAARALRTLQMSQSLDPKERRLLASDRTDLVRMIEQGWRSFNKQPTLNEEAQTRAGSNAPLLLRTEGRYLMRMEILALLSKGNDGVIPLDDLPASISRRYHLNVGLCRFGLLDLARARQAFESSFKNTAQSPIAQFNSLMYRASVDMMMLNLGDAENAIEEGKKLIETLDRGDQKDARRRISVRMAKYLWAKGGRKNLVRAARVFRETIRTDELIPIVGDAAIDCVDFLISDYDRELKKADQKLDDLDKLSQGKNSRRVEILLGLARTDVKSVRAIAGMEDAAAKGFKRPAKIMEKARATLERALLICETNASELGQRKFPHEVARFEIRRARILARLGTCEAAEALLDSVALSLARDGGSERTLHEFQLAAADVLIRQGNVVWAYACYLHGQLERTKALGFHLGAREVGQLALIALGECEKISSGAPNGSTAQRIKFAEAFKKKSEPSIWWRDAEARSEVLWEQLKRMSDNLVDPLYGYDLSALGRHLPIRDTHLAVKANRKRYRDLAEAAAMKN